MLGFLTQLYTCIMSSHRLLLVLCVMLPALLNIRTTKLVVVDFILLRPCYRLWEQFAPPPFNVFSYISAGKRFFFFSFFFCGQTFVTIYFTAILCMCSILDTNCFCFLLAFLADICLYCPNYDLQWG